MGGYTRLRSYFTYNPTDPGRVSPTDGCVVRLVEWLAPGSRVSDLGGDVSLNLLLEPADLVLRVHQPFVSRRRVIAVQQVRQRLDAKGLIVPVAVPWEGSPVLQCRQRCAELERRIRHERQTPSMATCRWLFEALGALHRALATLRTPVPRPVIATYTPPSTLRRWLAALYPAVGDDPEALETVGALRRILGQVRRRWVSSALLAMQLIHGDVHLANVVQTPAEQPAYLDFGSMGRAPRVHDLAYALAHLTLAVGRQHGPAPDEFPWHEVPRLLHAYESAAGARLTDLERQALTPYTAAIPLQYAARAAFFADPAATLESIRPSLHLSSWLLANPDMPLNTL